ncbi:hypothetical protein RB595_001256 [Gaeumannomyces hyphopodioides]
MEPVAQAYQGERDDVMGDQLLEVLARLLHAEYKDQSLLGPVGSLEQVVEFEIGVVGAVGEVLVHAAGVEVPDRGAAHDVHAGGPEDAKVDGRVGLLHEAGLFAPRAHAGVAGKGPQQLLHDELAGEGQDDGVEGDEGDVPAALAVLARAGVAGLGLERVREEDEAVDRVGLGRVGGEGERQHPRVLGGELLNPAGVGPGLTPPRAALGVLEGRALGLVGNAGGQARGARVAHAQLRAQATGLSASAGRGGAMVGRAVKVG